MTEDQFNKAAQAGQVAEAPQPVQVTPVPNQSNQQSSFDAQDYQPVLQVLRMPKTALAAVPTFQPKTFADSIQFVDDGVTQRPVFFINGNWVDLVTLVSTLSDPFKNLLDLIRWDSLDGFTEITSGSGSVAANDGNLDIATSNVLNSFHGIVSKGAYINLQQTGKVVTVEWLVSALPGVQDINDDQIRLYFTVDTGAGAIPSDTTDHFGFKLIGDSTGIKIYGSTADGTTEQATLIDTYSLATGNQYLRLKLVIDPGNGITYYKNGVMVGSSSLHLPTSASLYLSLTLKTLTGLQKEVQLGRVLIQKTP